MRNEWKYSAYDEDGNSVNCDICDGELKFNKRKCIWCCSDCGREMNRDLYFQYIGAEPSGEKCLKQCKTNYPFCKKKCKYYSIDISDPIIN